MDIASSYKNIGSLYFDKEDFIQAISYFKNALDIFIKAVGANHPFTTDTRESIKVTYEILLILHPNDGKINANNWYPIFNQI